MKVYSRIAIIGNSCGGKTKLARCLAKKFKLPLIHVDQIQYLEGLKFRPYKESIQILNIEQNKSEWIIDGFGPLDILENRLEKSDLIIMIDLPIWVHYFWAVKRTLQLMIKRQRQELPHNSSERNIKHIRKLLKTIYQVHTKMRPEMLRILDRENFKQKTQIIRTIDELNTWIKP